MHPNTTHGMSYTREYRVWSGMIQRCTNPNQSTYKHYGGRGISVDKRWKDSFLAFLDDMGTAPSKEHTLERKNNNQGYEPGNCRWATRKEQANNTRNTIRIIYQGKEYTLKELAELAGVSRTTLYQRLRKQKLSVEEAVTKPPRRAYVSRKIHSQGTT
jgi:DNA-binding NtrC family response regulator